MLSAYRLHEHIVAPARAVSDPVRLLIGVALVEALYAAAMALTDAMLDPLPNAWTEGYYYGTTRLGLIAQLFSFVLLGAAVVLAAKILQRREALGLFGIGPGWRQMRQVTLAVLGLFLLTELLPPYWNTDGIAVNGLFSWIALMPVTLAALLTQVGAEELFYRGYVQSQIAARFNSPWVWLTVPNLLFAYAHWDSAAPLNDAIQYVVWAFCFGVAASDLTARTGNLGAAAGFHLANNIYAFMFFGDEGMDDSGLALFLFPSDGGEEYGTYAESAPMDWLNAGFAVELGFVLLMWLAARVAVRR